LLHKEAQLTCPAIHPLNQLSRGSQVWNYRRNNVRKLARAKKASLASKTANHAINAIYNSDLDITRIDGWRICPAKHADHEGNSITNNQVQYHAHFAPMIIIEKWALPFFTKSGFEADTKLPVARTDIECACCQICNYHYGYESADTEPLFHDMYVCDTCHRTYHWKCMNDLGCYTDDQRQEIEEADPWACPACIDLTHDQKAAREQQSRDELWRVTWKPSWEPE